MNQIILSPFTLDELTGALAVKIEQLLEQKANADLKEKLLTPQETKGMLRCAMSTVYKCTDEGKLIAHKIGGKTFYKYEEVLLALNKKRNHTRTPKTLR